MASVVFIDTSVMLNLLDVPNMNDHREEVIKQFAGYQESDTVLVLPVTTIIETGNHVAHVATGLRRSCAEKLVGALTAALNDQPPWVLSGEAWDNSMVRALVDGTAQRPRALEFLTQEIGLGDVGILAEVEAYRRRVPSRTPISIWTLDHALAAYS